MYGAEMVDILAHHASTRCLKTGIHQAVSSAHNSTAIWVSMCLCQKTHTLCVGQSDAKGMTSRGCSGDEGGCSSGYVRVRDRKSDRVERCAGTEQLLAAGGAGGGDPPQQQL